MKLSKIFLVIMSILFSYNIYAQVNVIKYENSNYCSGTIANNGRAFSVFGGTGVIAAESQSWSSVMYSYVYADTWGGGSGSKGFKLLVNTTPYENLKISYVQMSEDNNGSNIGPRDFKLQYSTDDASYTDVPGGAVTLTGGDGFTNCTTISNLALPAECNNKSAVYLRWIMTSNSGTQGKGITAAGRSKLANLIITGTEMQVAPTNINLSNSTIVPYLPVNNTVGTLSAVDINTGNTHTFTLAAGAGDTHNGSFTITGTTLKVNALLAPGTYSIRVNVNDGTYNFAKIFSISVPGHAPTDITLSNNALWLSPEIGTTVGTLTAADVDVYDTFTYTLAAGAGDTHNGLFTIVGNALKTNAVIAAGSYSVRINVSDGTENYSEAFTITSSKIYPPIACTDQIFDYIEHVKFVTLDEAYDKAVVGGYGDFTSVTIPVVKGETYTMSVTNGSNIDVTYPQVIKAWFDWNDNGNFAEAGEEFTIEDSAITYSTFDLPITIPMGASEASVRLRIVLGGSGTQNRREVPGYSGTVPYGQAMDFTVVISAPLPVELISFSANAVDGKAKLTWKTATEVNNYGFEVEKQVSSRQDAVGSENNQHPEITNTQWIKVGFVAGAGNSNSPKEYSFVDSSLTAGKIQYRLKQIDTDGKFAYFSQIAEVNYSITDVKEKQIPTEFALEQNYPNPFNPSTKIQYAVGSGSVGKESQSSEQLVTLKVYDILGNEVATLVNEHKAPGYYEVEFNGSNLSTGVYIYKLTAGSFVSTKKLMLLK